MENLKQKVQELLGKEVIEFDLKGKGACNNAYVVKTSDGKKYTVKEERDVKDFQPQNDLIIEANVVKKLGEINLSLPVPKVVFVSENPCMYGYEYIEGEVLKNVWMQLSEEEKINICHTLGKFHAELGKKISKEDAEKLGVKINHSKDIHPESLKDYERLILDESVPEHFKSLAKKAREIFEGTFDTVVFQFLHNDAHHENILIKEKEIVGYIDFGESEYGEVAKEFSRYIRDFPNHFQYIVSAYEVASGNNLSYERLVSNALISGFIDIVEGYQKGGVEKIKAEKVIENYKRLI